MSETSYSYKLYKSDSDNSKTQSINLPDNITASDFVSMIQQKNLSNVGKIQIIKKKNNTQKTITLFVDDRVRTADEIKDVLKRKYGSVCGFTPNTKQSAPTVITGHTVRHRYGITGGYNILIDKDTTVFKEPKEVTWDELYAVVETLKAEKDIMVNRELKQIWPVQTGALPQAVQDFFVNTK